jgi:iron(III) transport system ATP-binding protein
MTAIRLSGLSKRFGETTAVESVDLIVESGELFFLLGPSGCGKTTILRMIAGFIEPTSGTIHFGDREVTAVPPNRRHTGMVFQSYALWPHMTVTDNVAYGLRVRRVAGAERARRVEEALRLVQMEAYGGRKPNELSGGQQQRVALARALVITPTVLLLDEPLSNLDAKLRLEMRAEIKRICGETGITTVYVTHDQKEALSMADRLAVLRNGRMVQVGPPRQVYDRPVDRFVADFLGETNFLEAVVEARDGSLVRLMSAAGAIVSSCGTSAGPGVRVTCSIRPEAIQRTADAGRPNSFASTHRSTVFLGEMAQHVFDLSGGTSVRVMELSGGSAPQPAGQASLHVAPEHVVILAD